MQNKKIIAIIIGIMFVICLALGVLGFLKSKKTDKEPEKPITYQVTYKYYLNDVEVARMPENPTLITPAEEASSSVQETDFKKLYAFNTATCTNNVTYTWNDSTWTFTPSNTADSTCSLYFVTTYNKVKIEVTNATITSSAETDIDRGKDAVIKIKPNEGYSFKESICTADQKAEWDKDANELLIRNVINETSCNVYFEISKFNVEIEVNMGSGTTKFESEYGKKIESKITPAEGYGSPTITCSNDQDGTWASDLFTIEKLTNETKCVVTFKKLQSKQEYTVSLDLMEKGTLLSGTNPTKVVAEGSVSWNVRANENYTVSDVTCDSGSGSVNPSENDYIITVSGITKDTECSVLYIPKE